MSKYIEVVWWYMEQHSLMFTVLFLLSVLIAMMWLDASRSVEEYMTEYPEDEE